MCILNMPIYTPMTDDSLSDEDKALFQNHMKGVKPLGGSTKKIQISKQTPPLPSRRRQAEKHAEAINYFLSDFVTEEVLSETALSFARPGIPNQRFRQLRQGEILWESRLDLHGLKADTARESLCQFIQRQYKNNQRCILIIHGKGGHLGAPPVIKNLINRWLPQLDEVMAFHSALPKDGGRGAVYVLLRRNREDYI